MLIHKNAPAATISAGLFVAAVAAAALGFFAPDDAVTPESLMPGPMPLMLLAFDLVGKRGVNPKVMTFLLPATAAAIFWLWCWLLFRGDRFVPRRTWALLFGLPLLSIAWFLVSWNLGVQHRGFSFAFGSAVASLVLACSTGLTAIAAHRRPTFGRNLVLHLVLFAWVFSYAFPYLGEAP